MALWGKGDARWIVEEREDAKNVNNWHWSEVNASAPSKKFLKDKFLELGVSGTEGSVRISEVCFVLFPSNKLQFPFNMTLLSIFIVEQPLWKLWFQVTKCEGEATVNNRKGKVIYFYEWSIELKWCGKTEISNDNVTGKIIIENVSEENTVCLRII